MEREMPLSKPVPIGYPDAGKDSQLLKEALEAMSLQSLLRVPWSTSSESYLRDLESQNDPRELRDMVRAEPKQWDLFFVAYAFRCLDEGSRLKSRKSGLSNLMFAGQKNSGAGWNLSQCVNYQFQLVLEFLVPIFHPQLPYMVPVSLANTFVASWKNQKPMNWALLLREAIVYQVRTLQ